MRVNAFVRHEQQRSHETVENICGVMVMTLPANRFALRDRLNALAGVEVHAVSDEGKLVLTVEDADGEWAGAIITRIGEVEDVLSLSLVYHHFDSDLEGEIAP